MQISRVGPRLHERIDLDHSPVAPNHGEVGRVQERAECSERVASVSGLFQDHVRRAYDEGIARIKCAP